MNEEIWFFFSGFYFLSIKFTFITILFRKIAFTFIFLDLHISPILRVSRFYFYVLRWLQKFIFIETVIYIYFLLA